MIFMEVEGWDMGVEVKHTIIAGTICGITDDVNGQGCHVHTIGNTFHCKESREQLVKTIQNVFRQMSMQGGLPSGVPILQGR